MIARVVLAQGERRGLLGFGTADDHLHALLAGDRRLAGEFARYVSTALRALLGIGVRFEGARIRTLQDQRHAYNTFHYVHRQDARHALGHDPMREGTSLPDLLGLRVLDTTLVSRVRESLPRIRRADLVTAYPSMASDDDSSSLMSVEVLADAAAAAFALTDLKGRSAEVARARHAAVHVMAPSVPSAQIGDCLGIGARAVRVLRSLPAEPLVVRAIRGLGPATNG